MTKLKSCVDIKDMQFTNVSSICQSSTKTFFHLPFLAMLAIIFQIT